MQLTKLSFFLPLIVSALAIAVPEADPGTRVTGSKEAAILQAKRNDLDKRQNCVPNGCKCNPVPQGQYCGWCSAVTNAGTGGSWSDVFECNPSGGCCRYGPRASCNNWPNFSPCG
ncbi:hypothetical protein TWF594_005752 [Orbilia oligospora]|nr:hypothetical protein TWF706_004302 [Orbilia oligospora]KAF3151996.1 hypothetical protein TWF594_005752 [Orbilia oligospora]